MQQIALIQIAILATQCVLVSFILLLLFRMRKFMGLGLVFTALGVFQFMQVFLATTFYMEIAPGIIISPGSVVLFCGTIFTVLLIYIREGALETRKVIYALMAANILVAIFQFTFGYELDNASIINTFELPAELFYFSARILLIGSVLLFLDAVLMIMLYEFMSRNFSSLFLRIWFTTATILVLDAILFSVLGLTETDQIKEMIFSGVISKFSASFLYSGIFTLYLCYFEKETSEHKSYSFNDIFSLLTYRQKFEQLTFESETLKFKSEKALFQSENRYNRIFNLSPVCLWEIDLSKVIEYIHELKNREVISLRQYFDLYPHAIEVIIFKIKIRSVNQATIELFGARNQEELTQNLNKTFTTRTLAILKEELISLDEGLTYHETESEVMTLKGEKRIVQISFSIISSNLVVKSDLLVAMKDITDRKLSEDALRKSTAILKESQRVGKLGSWELDIIKNELFWTDELYRIFELKPHDFKASYERFLAYIHPDDKKRAVDAYAASLKNKTPCQITHRLRLKDGTIKYVNEIFETEYDSDGTALRSFGTVNDITDIMKAQENSKELTSRYKLILDTTLDGFVLADSNGNIVETNESYRKMTGFNKSELLNMNLSQLEDTKSRHDFGEKLSEFFNSGGGQFETIHKTKSGNSLELSVSFSIMQKGDDENYVAVFCRDITQQKLSEKALRESKDFLQNSMDSVQDGISILSKEGIHVNVNPSLCMMTGFSKEELIGVKPPHPYWPEEEYENISKAFEKTLSGEKVNHELIFKRKDGRKFPVIVSPSSIPDVRGDVINYIATVKDISQRKNREQALQESENRFRTIFEQAAVGVALSDTKTGNYLRINQKYCDIVGYSLKEIRSTNFQSITHPEDLKRDMKLMDKLLEGSIDSYTMEKRFYKKNGDTVWVRLTVSPMWKPGDAANQHIAVIEDISDMKQLSRWKNMNTSLLEKTTKGIPLDIVITEINKGTDELIPGANSLTLLFDDNHQLVKVGESRLPKNWINQIVSRAKGPKSNALRKTIYSGKRIIYDDIKSHPTWEDFKDLAIENKLESCWIEPIISSDHETFLGAFIMFFAPERKLLEDKINFADSVTKMLSIIIEKTRAEDELKSYKNQLEDLVEERTKELEKKNQELESFSYSVSHDLRAPLTRIDGFSKALQESYLEKLDTKGRHYLDRIRVSSQDMGKIIDDILMLSRISRQDMVTVEVDLSRMAKSIIEHLKKSDPSHKVICTIEPRLIAQMDPGLARLLLENLLGNAWKFSKNATDPSIVLGRCALKDGIWFYVEDNGIGFDMKYYEQLFQPFHRLHSTDEVEGTGIGLATVKRIIEKHGGALKAKGKKDKGATFFFKL